MIKNYIFDFGNVLANFYPMDLTAPYVKDDEMCKIVSDVVFDRIYWNRLDDGSITDEEVKAAACARLPEELKECACKVYDGWVKTMTPVANMQELISDIKKTDKKLYLLSNISIGFADTYTEVPWIKDILENFDGLVFSGKVGMVKPDRDIFEYILSNFSLKAGECLFIDDSPVNIEGAKSVGIKGYLFDGDAQKLRDYLKL